MAAQFLWLAGVALETALLFRCVRCRYFQHFPVFSLYILCVWSVDILLWPIYRFEPRAYAEWYWVTQYVTLLLGYAVLVEIVRKSLSHYAGARQFATAIASGMLGVVLVYFIAQYLVTAHLNFAELERDLRTIQAVTLTGTLIVIAYYRIDMSKNLRGIVAGFGLYVGSSIVSLALRAYEGSRFDAGWKFIEPYTFLASLLIWTVALWSYTGERTVVEAWVAEDDYESFARTTRRVLETIRSRFKLTTQP